jgi:hypothetical protein
MLILCFGHSHKSLKYLNNFMSGRKVLRDLKVLRAHLTRDKSVIYFTEIYYKYFYAYMFNIMER